MKNNPNSIKNIIKRYFLKGDSDLKELPKQEVSNTVPYTPRPNKYRTKEIDITKDIHNPQMARAMKALQISNPFKGV